MCSIPKFRVLKIANHIVFFNRLYTKGKKEDTVMGFTKKLVIFYLLVILVAVSLSTQIAMAAGMFSYIIFIAIS